MKRLLIVESPAKIKTIQKFLGPDFKIMATMGHIKDLPTKEMGVTRDPITLSYVAIDKKEKTIADLCKAAAGVDEVYLAPDPDREGEIIAWHVYEEVKKLVKNPKNIFRIAFNEITKSAVIEAIEHPHTIDIKKVSAQQARRVLDRWVGYEVSPILWKKITKGLSAGRVQSVALKMICEREDAIRGFKPEEYWSITGLFKNEEGQLAAPLTNIGKEKAEIASQEAAEKILKDLEKANYSITEINDKTRVKNPLPPFMTSTLQQAAYNRLGFSVKKTMQLAQNLYEGINMGDSSPVALITYMRTDSLRIAESALTSVRSYISKKFGAKYLPPGANVYEKKSAAAAQDAHEAIRPIDVSITPDQVKAFAEPAQAKIYELIWHRFVASQMTPANFAQRQVVIKGDKYVFKATGSTLLFDGFLAAYNDEDDDSDATKDEKVKVPEGFKKDAALNLKKIDPKQHFTQPPPRYSEASLVKELEKEGIGRPSTYATIMNTICAREYTTVDKKRFIPTELGMHVTKVLNESFSHIMNVKFTANMEEDLDKIAEGKLDRDKLLNSFWENFEKDLIAFKGTTGRSSQPTDITCPECKEKKLVIRFGKAGEFIGCEGFPECAFTSNFVRDEATGAITLVEKEKPQTLDITCPQCKKPLREMMGKFGKFISCSGYPECKYIQQNKAGFQCPQDNGDVMERKWRGGTFWGCKNYPKCKYALFGDIQETPCPNCQAPALIKKLDPKTNGILLECADKKCGYKN
jgi:DNA topoisomerase-1